ncbi:hypothetical protein [Colwellia echini]|uniref:Uncharacterized protein n=1 Tax=Colwellia echini TaxID=1982103 RepID=A0ABY3MXS6_9GAMM|nr:hypothetical protein [Colwellia echini]TYK66020.1 hypothetical protein CWS31_007030 [Colwellia echini]
MPTKPNQPKNPSDWFDYGDKLVKLARKEFDKGNVTKKAVKYLNRLLKQLASIKASEQRELCQISAKRIERHVIDGGALEGEHIIYELNYLGMNQLSSLWKRFGRQIADAKHVEKFYPFKVKREQRQSFEDACLFLVDNNEEVIKDKYRHTYSNELDVDGLRLWLNESIEDREGKHKHKYDMELMFLIEYAMWKAMP